MCFKPKNVNLSKTYVQFLNKKKIIKTDGRTVEFLHHCKQTWLAKTAVRVKNITFILNILLNNIT